MDREAKSLEETKLGEIVDRPKDRKITRRQWVYALKEDVRGKVTLRKSRTALRGDLAAHGVDYFEALSPAEKTETLRMALALIIASKLKPLQVDVGAARLHAKLNDKVYMEATPGCPLPPSKVYRVLKALYGLPQSGRAWSKTFERLIESLGFVSIREDVCVLILAREGKVVAILALYVDDFLIGTDSDNAEAWLIKETTKTLKIKVLEMMMSNINNSMVSLSL